MSDQMHNESLGKEPQEFRLLIEALIENSKEQSIHHLEPFEEYVHSVRARFYADEVQFSSRFVKGYHVLLQQLASKN